MKVVQKHFFDEEDRIEIISKLGDPLEVLNRVIKWEMFRSVLTAARSKEDARHMT